MVIGFAAIGAAIIEQQLNMAAAQEKGAANVGAVTAFLSQVVAYTSLIGFVIQITLTSRIHRYLGIGFALLIIPVVDSATGLLMLLSGALWTSGAARVADTSLRYTVDKTTREILFLPLPVDMKYQAKPFIDVTVDRLAKGVGALILLVLVQPWGLGLEWRQLSVASITMMAIWAAFALNARREYMRAFRRSIEQQDVRPAELRLESADLSSIETLLTELSHNDPRRVIYAIDMLDALDKRQLVTPLLLRHDSPEVRSADAAARALHQPGGCRTVAARRGTCTRRRRRRSSAGRRASAGHLAWGSRGRRDASLSGSSRPEPGRDGGRGPGGQRRGSRRGPCRRDPEAVRGRHAGVRGRAAAPGGPGAGAGDESALQAAAGPAPLRRELQRRAGRREQRGHHQRRRFSVRADADRADAQPPAQGAGAQGAGRLRRRRRADAGVLPRRRRGGHLGAPSCAVDARADPVRGVGEGAALGARCPGRLPALQGGDSPRAHPARESGARHRPARDRAPDSRRARPCLWRADPARQPLRHRVGQPFMPARPRPEGEARARHEPGVSAARSHPAARGCRRGRDGASIRATPATGRTRSSCWTTC